MSEKLIATLTATLVAMMILAGSGTSVARKNSALKQRVAGLEQVIAGLEAENALQDRRIQSNNGLIRDLFLAVAELQTISPEQVITQDCTPGEDATWELIPPPDNLGYVALSC